MYRNSSQKQISAKEKKVKKNSARQYVLSGNPPTYLSA